ncbi:hypothetical protein FYJ24_07625 [Actinomycetaceae bacterium WB03_NA08]|uniref:N-acetylneuraminate lyase n=1 Tax=Scrofimicrobium canadense TaxID=2652290 RepID=A0A6N7W5P8_9ACTO|nr:dihydrodipicolinate synthase family protein [Scrofimicrobium canadense]MSS84635.1 hypothetical protein [Scrofimicrobium canadense]
MTTLLAALIACYDENGSVDVGRQKELIDYVLSQGIDGLFVSGSTGEAFTQSIEERKRTIAAAVQHVDGRAKVYAHVSALNTAESIELARYAAEVGVDALSAVSPIYYQYSEADCRDFYTTIARATDLPLFAYHIPSRTHQELSPRFFTQLGAEGVLQGIKYTSTDLYPLTELVGMAPEGFTILNGSDEVLLGGLALGADGGVGSTYNVIGGLYRGIAEAFAQQDMEQASDLQQRANRYIAVMNAGNFLAFLRASLVHLGIETGQSRRPLPPTTPEIQELAAVETDRAFSLLPMR